VEAEIDEMPCKSIPTSLTMEDQASALIPQGPVRSADTAGENPEENSPPELLYPATDVNRRGQKRRRSETELRAFNGAFEQNIVNKEPASASQLLDIKPCETSDFIHITVTSVFF
jgi:hypothetical protein